MLASDALRAGRRSTRRANAFPTVAVTCTALLVWGWIVREEVYLTPRFGLGYSLGIAGTAFMVLLLLYSVRKRVGLVRSWGAIRHWFNVHMILGILGPVAILFHANFSLGSVNSTVALGCVVLVASSGIIGRLIYPKIHHGLFGRRATLRELGDTAESSRGALGAALADSPELAQRLEEFEAFATSQRGGLVGTVARLLVLGARAGATHRRSLELLERSGGHREAERVLGAYVDGVRRVAEFGAYERLFSLWHAFHLPLCILLFVAAIVHVVAVHLY